MMRRSACLGVGLIALVALAGGCAADAPRRYECTRAQAPPDIDGRLDDAAWKTAAWTADFVDIVGARKPAPRYRTRAKLLWDDANLYIAAELEDPHVWGSVTEHDQIVFHDNDFEVFIDPDGDSRNYFELEINALNTIFDLLLVRTYIAGGPARHDWDCVGLGSASHIDGTLNDPSDVDEKWSVELAIPWSSLKPHAGVPLPPRPGDVWRMNFSRVEWQHDVVGNRYRRTPGLPEDNWVWSPQHVVNMHLPERWGYVKFVATASP